MRIIDGKKYTTKEDLQGKFWGIEKYKPGTHSVNDFIILTTSGTTTKRPTMFLRRVRFNRLLSNFHKLSKPTLVIANPNYAKLALVQNTKSTRSLFIDTHDMRHSLISSVIADFNPEIIYSVVSTFKFFIDKIYAKSTKAFPTKIGKIYLVGERLSETFSNILKEKYPKSEVMVTYGVTETGAAAGSCKYLNKRNRDNEFCIYYHPLKPVSIVQPDQDTIGEISIHTQGIPNYLTGDLGKIIKEKCKCGASKTLLMYGRINYDIVTCVGAVFYISEVERVLSSLGDYVKDYSLEIREIFEKEKTLGSVTIHVVPTEKLLHMENGEYFVSEFVKKHLQLTKTRVLGDLVRDGIFLSPKTVFVSSFPESGKKVRMRKVDV